MFCFATGRIFCTKLGISTSLQISPVTLPPVVRFEHLQFATQPIPPLSTKFSTLKVALPLTTTSLPAVFGSVQIRISIDWLDYDILYFTWATRFSHSMCIQTLSVLCFKIQFIVATVRALLIKCRCTNVILVN